MIKATRNGIKGRFSDIDWKSGQPQRYGWREEGKEGKTLPKEIVNFIERRKAPEPVKVEKVEPAKVVKPVKVAKLEKLETSSVKVKKLKTKKDDHSKQKRRAPGKRKPGAVEKN